MIVIFLVAVSILLYYLLVARGELTSTEEDVAKTCLNCGTRFQEGETLCRTCKESLKKQCPYCSQMINFGWNYCPNCENKLVGGQES